MQGTVKRVVGIGYFNKDHPCVCREQVEEYDRYGVIVGSSLRMQGTDIPLLH